MSTTRSITGGARWLLVLSLLISGCHTAVQHGLKERDANRIVAALQRDGVEARTVREEGRGGHYAVEVPRGQVTRAIQLLLQDELPHTPPPGFAEVYEKSSLIPSATEEQARYVHALSGEIARTLEAVSGVRQARVHVVVPRRDPLALRPAKGAPRAAVYLRVAPGKPPITVAEVQRLVAGSVDRLAPKDVAVVIRPSRPARAGSATPRYATVGPVSVSPDSRALLTALLAGGLVLILILAGAVAWLVLRLGRQRRRPTAAPLTAAAGEPTARVEPPEA